MIGVPSAEDIAACYRELVSDKSRPPGQRTLQPLYLALLDDIHFRYIKRMLDRRVRRETGAIMNMFGASCLLLLCVGLILYVGQYHNLQMMGPVFIAAVTFGMIGAFLSRLISFHAQLEQIDYDSLRNGFSQ